LSHHLAANHWSLSDNPNEPERRQALLIVKLLFQKNLHQLSECILSYTIQPTVEHDNFIKMLEACVRKVPIYEAKMLLADILRLRLPPQQRDAIKIGMLYNFKLLCLSTLLQRNLRYVLDKNTILLIYQERLEGAIKGIKKSTYAGNFTDQVKLFCAIVGSRFSPSRLPSASLWQAKPTALTQKPSLFPRKVTPIEDDEEEKSYSPRVTHRI
jgi:hypothetical protein